ncbi:MAG: bis(5'-nucleosyl)-tetraphosphatase (symmetrical) YqeK [Chloroflexi bacterium]|nr:bis(5'-nucleosyl)-tetraphosphatase (symmetrical) YqeK [Chloroflexota bacterium]
MAALPPAIESRLIELPLGLRDHVERAREVGQELAIRYGVDAVTVDLGIAAHDLARALKADALLSEAHSHGIEPGLVERHEPLLLHGPVAARWLEHDDQYDNAIVIQAVRWHTTGFAGMDEVAKTVFLADKLDPDKVTRYPYLKKVQSLASEDLDTAIVEYLDRQIEYLLNRGLLIHPASLEFRNHLIAGRDD